MNSSFLLDPAKYQDLVTFLKYNLSTLSIISSEPDSDISQLDGATLDISTTNLAQHDAVRQLRHQPGPILAPRACLSTLCENRMMKAINLDVKFFFFTFRLLAPGYKKTDEKHQLCNCHNPTDNSKQIKTTFVGVVL